MYSPSTDAPPVPGVDLACNALYLSLVGEMPEVLCPPGCTLQATAQGTIYVLDHVRRTGYPLQLATLASRPPQQPPVPALAPPLPVAPPAPLPVPSAPAPQQQQQPPAPPPPPPPPPQQQQQPSVSPYLSPPGMTASATFSYAGTVVSHSAEAAASRKHGRDNSVESGTASSSGPQSRRTRRDSRESSVNQSAMVSKNGPAQRFRSVSDAPQFCLIPPRHRWLEDIFFTLQISHLFQDRDCVFFYCHYCRTYTPPSATGLWRHLSDNRGHLVQRQRIRGYMVSGCKLLNTAEKRMFGLASVSDINSMPSKFFLHAERFQRPQGMEFAPACVRFRSLLSSEDRERVWRDGCADAKKAISRENLLGTNLRSYEEESPQLVGWRFVMEGLDVVTCYCDKTNERLMEHNLASHHRSSGK